MSKRWIWLLVALSATGLWLLSFSQSTKAPPTVADAPDTMVAPAPPAVEPAGPVPSPAGGVLDDGDQIANMYESLAAALERHGDDCGDLGREYDAVIAQHAPSIERFARSRAALDGAGRERLDQHLQHRLGRRLENARRAVQDAMAQCKQDPTVRAALLRLANLNAS
jgi:hypothetical protein